jgi:hypothetical protein
MYATTGVREILGLEPDQLTSQSFYYMIDEGCLQDSVKCLETAKSNDSIAYLRFKYRNPLQQPSRAHSVTMSDMEESDEEDGGVAIPQSRSSGSMRTSVTPQPDVSAILDRGVHSSDSVPQLNGTAHNNETATANGVNGHHADDPHRSSSDQSMDQARAARDALFDRDPGNHSTSTTNTTPDEQVLELEAVISCTSDGLVVVLRKARALVPPAMSDVATPDFDNGIFATPWASSPILPTSTQQASAMPNVGFPSMPDPAEAGLMAAIRDVAVFAWSLTGINGSLADYAKGEPIGDATPPGGLAIWDPNATSDLHEEVNGFSGSRHRPISSMGEPQPRGKEKADSTTSSDDEVVYKVR